MAKTNRKLSVKKETLRSLTAEQLGQVAGGTGGAIGYTVVQPPSKGPVTGGCVPTNGCIDIIGSLNVVKGYP